MFANTVYAQPIISKARPDLLRSHFIPTLEKLKKKAIKTVQEEEQLRAQVGAWSRWGWDMVSDGW